MTVLYSIQLLIFAKKLLFYDWVVTITCLMGKKYIKST